MIYTIFLSVSSDYKFLIWWATGGGLNFGMNLGVEMNVYVMHTSLFMLKLALKKVGWRTSGLLPIRGCFETHLL